MSTQRSKAKLKKLYNYNPLRKNLYFNLIFPRTKLKGPVYVFQSDS